MKNVLNMKKKFFHKEENIGILNYLEEKYN